MQAVTDSLTSMENQ